MLTRCRVSIPSHAAALPPPLFSTTPIRRIALADFLTRSFAAAERASAGDVRAGSGGWHGAKGGEISVDCPGQNVIERTSVIVNALDGSIEARFSVGLPAQERSISGDWAATVLTKNLPQYIRSGLLYCNLDAAKIERHVSCVEDTEYLRNALPSLGLIAFIGDGSILPRKSGAADEALSAEEAIPFLSPPSLAVEIQLPHRGLVRGMGVRKGITLICGGGFHGKTTLLEALEKGVYNKIPDGNDGRELVATDPTAVKIRAENARRISAVDISPYISNLPLGRDTHSFSSDNASGSTSQAANIQEALEIGCTTLLIDEDTSASNFMVRDARMRELVSPEKEPITPFVSRIRALSASGVSCVLVIGGTGDYFAAADCVIALDCYKVEDVTVRAHEIAAKYHTFNESDAKLEQEKYPVVPCRNILSLHGSSSGSSSQNRGGDGPRVKTRSLHGISVDDEELDLNAVEQLVEVSQTRAIAESLLMLRKKVGVGGPWRGLSLAEIMDRVEGEMDDGGGGLDSLVLGGRKYGNLARPRRFELCAAVNRLRTAEMTQATIP